MAVGAPPSLLQSLQAQGVLLPSEREALRLSIRAEDTLKTFCPRIQRNPLSFSINEEEFPQLKQYQLQVIYSTLALHTERLEDLSLSNTNHSAIALVARACRHLKTLYLQGNSEDGRVLEEKILKFFIKKNKELQELDIRDQEGLTNECLDLAGQRAHLKKLLLDLSSAPTTPLSLDALTLRENFPQLKTLGLRFKPELALPLAEIAQSHPHLERLELGDGTGDSENLNSILVAAAPHLKNLMSLSLDVENLADETLQAIATHCQDLRKVSLVGRVNAIGVGQFITSLQKLECLEVVGLSQEDYEELDQIKHRIAHQPGFQLSSVVSLEELGP